MWGHILFKDSISLWLQFLKCFVWLFDHYIILNMFFGSEKVMSNPIFFNVRNVKSSLVELKWQKPWQWSEKINLENLLRTRLVCKTYEIFKFLLHQNVLRVCTKPERTTIAQDYAKFTNSIVLGKNFVPLEMKTFVNIGNSFGMVITRYPWYINNSNSLSVLLSKLYKKHKKSSGMSLKLLYLERNKLGCICGIYM